MRLSPKHEHNVYFMVSLLGGIASAITNAIAKCDAMVASQDQNETFAEFGSRQFRTPAFCMVTSAHRSLEEEED